MNTPTEIVAFFLNHPKRTYREIANRLQIPVGFLAKCITEDSGLSLEELKKIRHKRNYHRRIERYPSWSMVCSGCKKAFSYQRKEPFIRIPLCPECKAIRVVHKRDPLITRECLYCGIPFHPMIADRNTARFCSPECYIDYKDQKKHYLEIYR